MSNSQKENHQLPHSNGPKVIFRKFSERFGVGELGRIVSGLGGSLRFDGDFLQKIVQ